MFYDLSLLYFVSLDSLIGSVLIVTPILSSEFASLIFSVLLLQLKFLFSSDIYFRFSCSGLMMPLVSFTPFSFPSLTLLSLSSPFMLHPFFPTLISLFWLSITKSNAFALLSSFDSLFSSCPSILFMSCYSIFNLLNTFFKFSSRGRWNKARLKVFFSYCCCYHLEMVEGILVVI